MKSHINQRSGMMHFLRLRRFTNSTYKLFFCFVSAYTGLIFLLLFLLTLVPTSGFSQTNSDKSLRKLERDSLMMDIDLLEQALTEIHPGIYRYNTEVDIRNHFKLLRDQLCDGISEGEYMIRLAQTVRKLKCGHTYLNPWNMPRETRERLFGSKIYLPLGFRIIDGRFYVTHNASESKDILKGAEILAINGVSASTIYDSLYTISRSDGNNFAPADDYLSLQNFKKRNWEAFDLYFSLFFPLQQVSFVIRYRNFGEVQAKQANIAALSKAERAKAMLETYGEEVLGNEDWSVDILSNELAIMRLGTFAIWNWKDFDPKQWFADAFAQLDSLQIPNLIVDIRGNGGGLSEPRDELMTYLVDKDIACGEQARVLIRTTKLNPNLVPYIDTWVKPLIDGLPEQYYEAHEKDWYRLKEEADCQDLIPKQHRFEGKTYIFGGASNVSATFTLLEKAKEYGFATFVGQTSGGNQQGINGGEYAFFYLPYSKLEVDIPLKYFAPVNPQPDAGIEPAIPIKLTQADIAKATDPLLEYVLQSIRAAQK